MKSTTVPESIRNLHPSISLSNENDNLLLGIGGAGVLASAYLTNKIPNLDCMIADSNAKVIQKHPELPYLLLGPTKLAGMACGSPANGELSAKASARNIQKTLYGYQKLVLVIGLGGGCGTGAVGEIIKLAKEMEISVHVLTTLPFEFEPRLRKIACKYKENIKDLADSYHEFDNQLYSEQQSFVTKEATLQEFFQLIHDEMFDCIVSEVMILEQS